jgi:hypothetical protein
VSYQLVLTEPKSERTKDVGENVFLNNLPQHYKVYLFYYPGLNANNILETKLRNLGEMTGNNLFVNIGRLNDPHFNKIVKKFQIKDFPVIIVTAIDTLASIENNGQFLTAYLSNYIKIDNQNLLKSVDLAIKAVEKQFTLFLSGRIVEAINQIKQDKRDVIISKLKIFVGTALKDIDKFFSERDIIISLVEGKLELRKNLTSSDK